MGVRGEALQRVNRPFPGRDNGQQPARSRFNPPSRLGLLHDPGTQIRRVSQRKGRCATGEAGDRHVEAAPEEMHGAHLAEESPAEPGKDPLHLDQNPPEACDVFRVVGGVRSVLLEWNCVGYLDRDGPDPRFQPESAKTAHYLRVEIRHGSRAENDGFNLASACLQLQRVIDEIEVDLTGSEKSSAHGRLRTKEPATNG
jgi:hypothetical protein